MSLLTTLENDYHNLIAKILTPQATTIIAGQIATANLTQPSASGAQKQSTVATTIAALYQIGESLALALVKTVFNLLQAQTPSVLIPVVTAAETSAEQILTSVAQNLTPSTTAKLDPASPLPGTPSTLSAPQASTSTSTNNNTPTTP